MAEPYGDDQRIELLEQAVCTLATILAELVQDRATIYRLARITARYTMPAADAPVPPPGDISTPVTLA